jgi:nucleoside 2-deoxyribosyltransferase
MGFWFFPNVQTYRHRCGFRIAVLERIEADDFNPNVSLEIGYMLAQRKPVLLLKDGTLRQLHTDLVGRLYRHFDFQRPAKTILIHLKNWLEDKGLI